VRKWLRTSADPRSCALWQLSQLYQQEFASFLDEESLCGCDCDKTSKKKTKKEKKEWKEMKKKMRRREKELKKKSKEAQLFSVPETENALNFPRESTRASKLVEPHQPEQLAERIPKAEVSVLGTSHSKPKVIKVPDVREMVSVPFFETAPLEKIRDTIPRRPPPTEAGFIRSQTAPQAHEEAVRIQTEFGIANQRAVMDIRRKEPHQFSARCAPCQIP